ncbi:ribosome maturation factor RimP [Williamsia sp. CHRR-6]|uniref:ribosome maturation factor RimP n=1 Tax=Williamsia sp. CHRR-6 TaxID=2835871 RepID=UPI001BDA0E46|nr:ribosome maturation factor RimP [Williamsia sp. CHRR-6]MBT0568407.1 ribosome maturation factor RimP [Williamsia sp. CHRR-6]
MSDDSDRVATSVRSLIASAGLDLEDVVVMRNGDRSVIRVVVDSDSGTELDQLAELSRAVSDVLDADPAPVLGGLAYTLEITSPGVDRPLTAPRHWRRAQGRKVIVEMLEEREPLAGRVGRLGADEATVELVLGARGRPHIRTVALDRVQRAVVQVDFSGPTAAERELCGLPAAGAPPPPRDLTDLREVTDHPRDPSPDDHRA